MMAAMKEDVRVISEVASANDMPAGYVVSWYKVILQINSAGCSTQKISEETGINLSRIKGWKSHGYRLKFEDGVKIIKLWKRETGKTEAQLPIEVSMSASEIK